MSKEIQEKITTPDLNTIQFISSGKGRILLIDDENIIRVTVQKILGGCGYDVLVAEDGESGIEIYRNNMNEIKLVILDMSMAKMSGKDTFLQLKKLNPQVKVIISSGFRMDERIEETLQNGAVDFVGKPFTFSELAAIVKKHVASPPTPSPF